MSDLAWLDEIERWAAAATPGPWRIGKALTCAVNDGSHKDWQAPPDIAQGQCALCGGPAKLIRTTVGENGGTLHVHLAGLDDWHHLVSEATGEEIAGNYDYEEGGICSRKEDAVFIARARTDIPLLCRAVRELYRALHHMVEAVDADWLVNGCDCIEVPSEVRQALERWQRRGEGE